MDIKYLQTTVFCYLLSSIVCEQGCKTTAQRETRSWMNKHNIGKMLSRMLVSHFFMWTSIMDNDFSKAFWPMRRYL